MPLLERTVVQPHINVVLVEPEIPPNTGNIARMCGAVEARLHLVHPLGFNVDDKQLKRAGLDYWHLVDIVHHDSVEVFIRDYGHKSLFCFSKKGDEIYTKAPYSSGCYLLLGSETSGLPDQLMSCYPSFRLPMSGKVRSLNLSTAAGIVAYEALRQICGW